MHSYSWLKKVFLLMKLTHSSVLQTELEEKDIIDELNRLNKLKKYIERVKSYILDLEKTVSHVEKCNKIIKGISTEFEIITENHDDLHNFIPNESLLNKKIKEQNIDDSQILQEKLSNYNEHIIIFVNEARKSLNFIHEFLINALKDLDSN